MAGDMRFHFRPHCFVASVVAVCIPMCQAQQSSGTLSVQAQKIQSKILAMPAGKHLTVIMKDGSEYCGALVSTSASGFVVAEVDLKKEIAVQYEDVKKVLNGYGGKNSVTGHRVHMVRARIVTLAIVGGITLILLVALATDKS